MGYPSSLLVVEVCAALEVGRDAPINAGAGKLGSVPDLPDPPTTVPLGLCLGATEVAPECIGEVPLPIVYSYIA